MIDPVLDGFARTVTLNLMVADGFARTVTLNLMVAAFLGGLLGGLNAWWYYALGGVALTAVIFTTHRYCRQILELTYWTGRRDEADLLLELQRDALDAQALDQEWSA